MTDRAHSNNVIQFYDTHPINEQQIMEKLATDNVVLETLTEDVLQHYDMDHYDGVSAIDKLATAAYLGPDHHVLDVASGMGGPARYLAHNYGCRVTGIDLTESRIDGATRLTALVGLAEQVDFRSANALENPFADGTFDVVIGEEAWCHIPDKQRLVQECVRVTKKGGCLSFTDILERDGLADDDRQTLHDGMGYADLGSLDEYHDLLTAAGCIVEEVEDLSDRWTVILRERLEMYRSLKAQTAANFGDEVHDRWDRIYSLFVGEIEAGHIGGGRFLARKK